MPMIWPSLKSQFSGVNASEPLSTWHLLLKCCQRNAPEQLPAETIRAQLLVAPHSEQASRLLTQSSCCLETTVTTWDPWGKPSGVLVHVSAPFMCEKHRQQVQGGILLIGWVCFCVRWKTRHLHEVASRTPFALWALPVCLTEEIPKIRLTLGQFLLKIMSLKECVRAISFPSL